MGRPPKNPLEVKGLSVRIAVSSAELQELEQRARDANLPLRTFIRTCALGAPLPAPVPEVNQRLAVSLARVGGNLNQYLHAIHTKQAKEPPVVDLIQLQDLLAQVRRLLRQGSP